MQNRQTDQNRDDPADHWREILDRNEWHRHPANNHADDCRRQNAPKHAPDGVAVEGPHGENIREDQHRQDHAGGLPGGDDLGHQENANHRHAAEAAFAHAESQRRKGGEGPLECGEISEVRHR